MKINFLLAWARGEIGSRDFKSKECAGLFTEYLKRLAHFAPIKAGGFRGDPARAAGRVVWFCDTVSQAKTWTSEETARQIKLLEVAGTKELEIVIGGPDGFDDRIREALKPDRLWSFGPITLPHELAAVVAAEQIYRAYTINRGLPYHGGH